MTGIDISEVAIEQARTKANRLGLPIRYEIMDAEALAFASASFDVVCGSGILHHLNLDKAYGEIARILSVSGSAVFIEPLGHNPIINLYRKLTPAMRTEDEHPLLAKDLRAARKFFEQVECRHFHFLALLAVPFRTRRIFKPILAILEAIDRFLFRWIPPARRLSWIVVITLSKPRRGGNGTIDFQLMSGHIS